MIALHRDNLDTFNSLTKYPSIPTFHPLDPRGGGLLEPPLDFEGEVLLTEKVDGTNTRIAFTPDGDYVIGSRGELLHARGDRIHNPALGIVDAVRDVAEHIARTRTFEHVTVFFGEVFGGNVTRASKQYTSERAVGFRLFDVLEVEDAEARLSLAPDALARWRESGGQRFVDESRLAAEAERAGVPLTPRLGRVTVLPQSIEEGLAFLQAHIPRTHSALDEGAGGQPEGVVVRSLDRARIAKLRFADYARTLKRRR